MMGLRKKKTMNFEPSELKMLNNSNIHDDRYTRSSKNTAAILAVFIHIFLQCRQSCFISGASLQIICFIIIALFLNEGPIS